MILRLVQLPNIVLKPLRLLVKILKIRVDNLQRRDIVDQVRLDMLC